MLEPSNNDELRRSRQALLHDRRGERPVRVKPPRAALLGAGIPAAEAREASRQPSLLPAPGRAGDPPDPSAALRPGLHHRGARIVSTARKRARTSRRRSRSCARCARAGGAAEDDEALRKGQGTGDRDSKKAGECRPFFFRTVPMPYPCPFRYNPPGRSVAQSGSALAWGARVRVRISALRPVFPRLLQRRILKRLT